MKQEIRSMDTSTRASRNGYMAPEHPDEERKIGRPDPDAVPHRRPNRRNDDDDDDGYFIPINRAALNNTVFGTLAVYQAGGGGTRPNRNGR